MWTKKFKREKKGKRSEKGVQSFQVFRTPLPLQESQPDPRGAPHCSLIGPRAGVEELELAVALQAAAVRERVQLFNHPVSTGGKDPCSVEPQGLDQKGWRTPSGGRNIT